MKVLWFEISTPSCYYSDNRVVEGGKILWNALSKDVLILNLL